uniref:Beta-carotene isomerase D27-like C-terminal domain-containing protein n=2 Tax=Chrysotila carterae TaxID=13221 RepID=A0A7S4AZ00_CHRCT
MLRATEQQQHAMVYNALAGLLTPAMPLVYKPFMSGVLGNRTFGPWFYAPLATAVVTPPFFNFLVGPSRPNLRRDGMPGGLVVEKCRFLQQSQCKGICMHMCKLPAQQFFQQELGMPLTVSPIFETQECQWSFGEVPLPPEEDPLIPKGCISDCTSRVAMKEARITGAKPCL